LVVSLCKYLSSRSADNWKFWKLVGIVEIPRISGQNILFEPKISDISGRI